MTDQSPTKDSNVVLEEILWTLSDKVLAAGKHKSYSDSVYEAKSQIAKRIEQEVLRELEAVLNYNADIDNYGWEQYVKDRIAQLTKLERKPQP